MMFALNRLTNLGCLVAVGLLVCATGQATQPDLYPRIDADLEIVAPSDIRIGEPFVVTFAIKCNEALHMKNDNPMTARIRPPKNAIYVAGDTLWQGFLQLGEQVSITATYEFEGPFRGRFKGVLKAVVGKGPKNPDNGEYRYNTHVNGVKSNLLASAEVTTDNLVPVLSVTDSGIKATQSFLPAPPVQVFEGDLDFDLGESIAAVKPPTDVPTKSASTAVIPLQLNLSATPADTMRLNYWPGRLCTFVIEDGRSQDVRLELVSGDAAFIQETGGSGVFELRSDRAVFIVKSGTIERTLLLVQGESYWINGTATFRDRWGVDHPIRDGVVGLFHASGGEWYLDLSQPTDQDGDFTFVAYDDTIAVQVISQNYLTEVWYPMDHDFTEDDSFTHYAISVTAENLGHLDVVIPDSYLNITDLAVSGAFNIMDAFIDCYDFLRYDLGEHEVLTPNVTIWDDEDDYKETSGHNAFTVGGVPGFYIASRGNYLDNWDEWDRAVLCHEYGHKVMYGHMERIPDANGSWRYLEPTSGANNQGLAVSEGWANLFSAVVRDDPVYVNTTYYDDNYIVRNYETPAPDAPYYHWWDITDPLPRPRSVPQIEGAHVPGAVTITLWDLFDSVDDDEYYESGEVWGHNNDHNSAETWRGIDAIWDVLTNFDPQPDNPDHDHCWNIYEFIHGWDDLGYPIDDTFIDLFEAHGIDVFIPGNVTGDRKQEVTIGDISFVIDHLFIDGTVLDRPSAADVNASCGNREDLTIGDVSIMIDALFISGDRSIMLAGCINLYP